MRFEWDPAKDRLNWRKHGIGFDEAITVFEDPFGDDRVDTGHSDENELRMELIGRNPVGRLLTVIYTERGSDDEYDEEKIRIISARSSTRQERARYEARFHDA